MSSGVSVRQIEGEISLEDLPRGCGTSRSRSVILEDEHACMPREPTSDDARIMERNLAHGQAHKITKNRRVPSEAASVINQAPFSGHENSSCTISFLSSTSLASVEELCLRTPSAVRERSEQDRTGVVESPTVDVFCSALRFSSDESESRRRAVWTNG